MTAHISGKAVAFSSTIDPAHLILQADPELVEQVLINLLLNALQAVEGRAAAAVSLRAFLDERGRILVQVADNGPGIPPENLEKIFVPFFSTKAGGSGIGLSLSRQIMRLHGGTLHVHSEPGVQTVFTLGF
jgi:signal transduction histidine kinase